MMAGFLKWLLIAAVRLLAQPRWLGSRPGGEQCIYVANHTSHLDTLLLLASLPAALRNCTRPVASEEYWDAYPVRRYLIRSVFRGVLLARREGLSNPLQPAADALRQGDSLIFFPEGTRGSGRKLQPLKPGILHLSQWFPEIDVIPVWIDGSYRSLPKGFVVPLPRRCSITFGTPMHVKGEEFLAELRDALEGLRPL